MTTIVTRAGKGSPLTHTEVDTNFTNLNTAKLETAAIPLGTAAAPSVSFVSDANTGIFSPGADQLAISTNGTEKLIVLSNGNVGIGTSSPDSKLSIFSANSGSANNTLTGSWLNIGSSITSGLGIRQKNSDLGISGLGFPLQIATIGNLPFEIYTTDAQPLVFGTSAVERLRITSAGNVGIGTTSPGSALEINAAAATSPFIAKINTAEAARIDSSGRLLVGTSSAGAGAVDAASIVGSTLNQSTGLRTLSSGGTLDLNLLGTGIVGHLYVTSANTANAALRASTIFFITTRQGNATTITSLNSADGSSGGRSFTITNPSANIFRFTDTSSSDCSVSMSFVGGIGF